MTKQAHEVRSFEELRAQQQRRDDFRVLEFDAKQYLSRYDKERQRITNKSASKVAKYHNDGTSGPTQGHYPVPDDLKCWLITIDVILAKIANPGARLLLDKLVEGRTLAQIRADLNMTSRDARGAYEFAIRKFMREVQARQLPVTPKEVKRAA
jgi:hypothetical protein